MNFSKLNREKKNFLVKAWRKYQYHPKMGKDKSTFSKNISCQSAGISIKGRRVAPTGCFFVYVGSEKQRFVIKVKDANHPLFISLLEDAESEYGHNSNGPILLPCDVDSFYKVLAEMENVQETYQNGCGLVYGSCSPFSPTRRLGNTDMAKGYGSYEFLAHPHQGC